MLNDASKFEKVYIACGRTDLRRGIDGLASIVKYNFKMDPFQKNVLQQIAAIYHLDNSYSELQSAERLKMRQLTVKPQVEDFFAWAKQMVESNSISSEMTLKGLNYCINQEENPITIL